ncbi:MAG TPA: lactonase family protein [Gemmataceae bacterium]|nr:lactonase family protein [Gemmataceae bacterium]
MSLSLPTGLTVILALLLSLGLAMPADAAGTGKLWVYIGPYTGQGSQGIYRCDFDPALGRLTEPTLAAKTDNPSFLAVDPSRRYLFAVNEVEQWHGQKTGAISAFAIDPKTGALTPLNQQSSHGTSPCHLTVDKAGKHVLVANYGSGSVAVLPIGSDGRLGQATCVIQHHGHSVNAQRQEGPHCHCVKLDAANRFALVCDLGLDKVMIYRYDAESGKLTPNDPPSASVKPGSGPRHIALRPDQQNAYVINEMASTITAFRLNRDSGALTPIETVSTLPADYHAETSGAEIEVHPSGKWVYGSNRGYNSVVEFAIDSGSGKLTLVEQQRSHINVPRSFAITPDGLHALVANQDGKSVLAFTIDAQNGKFKPTESRVEVANAVCVLPIRPPEQ